MAKSEESTPVAQELNDSNTALLPFPRRIVESEQPGPLLPSHVLVLLTGSNFHLPDGATSLSSSYRILP
jgi:hypothetical protein